MRREPLIIGGGPAGTAAAIRLGLCGLRPRLIERTSGPTDKVCGDFLGADAIERLADLGIDPASLGAEPIRRLRLVHRNRISEVLLPFPAVGLSRRRLDEALLGRAEATGTQVGRGVAVRRITRGVDHWLVHTTSADRITATDVFLATGKHDLRNLPRPAAEHGAVGMKMYFSLAPAPAAELSGTIVLVLFPGGYAGLQHVEDGRTVFCIAVSRTRFQATGATWSNLLDMVTAGCPPLSEMLVRATALLPRALAVAGVPYGFLHWPLPAAQAPPGRDGLFRLGDQAAVIASLTGDGIAIALHSGALAARVWQAGGDAPAYHRRLAEDLGSQMRLAGWLHRVAMNGAVQAVAVRGAQCFPGVLRQAARGTRLRHQTHTLGHETTSGLHPA